ncbi:glycosyltransferase family 2 protein [Rathayibacter soli]|uniref:glycosyltransferase family 2 protein n=1 Tax=Rathayibacter soli TaxID=3144168 RepID=UPI0027E4B60B|nr:glycosyltransferase family 2 protein [Glaciibacter superstes]
MKRGSEVRATGEAGDQPATSRDKVSVIIPLFNGDAFIEQTIRCVLNQTHRNLEVIVVDDGSTDGGVEIVRRLLADERVALVLKPHAGIGATRNVGLAWADSSSAYVLFLDQDDKLERDLVAGLVHRLARRPDAVGGHAIADDIDSADRAIGDGSFAGLMRSRRRLSGGRMATAPSDTDVVWPEIFPANNLYPPSAVLLRYRDVVAVGGFDPRYAVADDWDLMLRLLRRGPFVSWDDVQVGYRRYDGNASGDHGRNVRETRAVWATTYYSAANTRGDRALLRRWWRAHQWATAHRKFSEARALLMKLQFARAIGRAADAAAHVALLTPWRRWRLPDAAGDLADRVAPLGRRERGGDSTE